MTSSATPFPIGAYLNAPDGGDASNQAVFQTNYDSFTALMGTAPSYLDYFTDYTQPVSDWVSNAGWQAWSAVQAGPDATNAIPVIALPMYSTAAGQLSPGQQYQAIISGADDSVYTGIVDAWAADGFKSLVFRPGWEMNIPGNTYAGDSAQDQSDWVAAFQHIYTVLHAAATAAGVAVSVVWNPATISYSNAEATTNLYPGNNYVDAIGADVYADAGPYTNTPGGVYQDWATGGTDSTLAQFVSNPINMEHYWTYPAATVYANDSSGGHSQSLDSLIQFAEQQDKPFDIPEGGAGNSNSGGDVADESAFPQWLASQLTTVQSTGETIGFVNLWDSNGGGNYEFSNASDNKPAEAAAWAKYFGAQPVTASPGSSTAAASANDTVLNGTTGAITDASGNTWTITRTGQVAVNGVTDTTTGGVIELAYVNGIIWAENGNNVWWGKAQPGDAWGPSAGTTSPLPATSSAAAPTSTAAASPNDTVLNGTTGAITDASGKAWTITANGQVAVNGVTDTTTGGVIELAYVNGAIWAENGNGVWWGRAQPSAAWGPSAGTTSPLPATPVTVSSPTVSSNDTVVLSGSSASITDARGNTWTITGSGQVALNGVTDTTTGGVAEAAYVNGAIWAENGNGVWWGKAQPSAAWGPSAGTTTPLPSPIIIGYGSGSNTVSLSQVSVVATSGNQMVFVSGSGDILNLSGGTDTVTDTGSGNTYILPAAGNGSNSFTSNILANGDILDLKTALAATNWNGEASTVSSYLTVSDTAQGATLSVAPTAGGAAVTIATIDGATGATLSTVLAHAFT